jgi:Zn-finger nucleic acid-binding protein
MNCPRDGAALRQVVRQGITIDVCTRCHGKWLDQGELEHLVRAARSGATGGALEAALEAAERSTFFRPTGGDPKLACPRCGVTMQKVGFESRGAQLTADRCEACKGFWLDAGETGALFVFLEERLPVRRAVWALVALATVFILLTAYRLMSS